MTIAFIHPHQSFLPEINAYVDFFTSREIKTVIANPGELNGLDPGVEWHFMGTHLHRKWKNSLLIHEYASASLPPFRKLKDNLKKWTNCKPDFRLFLNNYVKDQMDFNDPIPFGFRDMGISPDLFSSFQKNYRKEYDFIYIGSVSADMQMEKLLTVFTRSDLQKKTLCIVSKQYDRLREKFSAYKNIIFRGPVSHSEIAAYLLRANFCINYKPVIEPHAHQTPTKFLEYLACRIPVISTDFAWVRTFQQRYGGSYFYLNKDLSNFSWDAITQFEYGFPNLNEWTWKNQISQSGVVELLRSRFPELSF